MSGIRQRTSTWISTAAAATALAGAARAGGEIPVLIVSGANNHDWQWTTPMLAETLASTGRFEVDVTYQPANALADRAALARYRAIVLDYNGPRWGEPAESSFLDAVRGGAGVAVIHAANNAFPDWPEYQELVGDCWIQGTTAHGKFHAFDVKIVDASHPITSALGEFAAHPDELYHDLVRTPGTSHRVLATALSSKESGGTGEDEPMILAGSYGQGRVFHTPLGHVWPGATDQRASHRDPQFQRLVARGVEWAATGAVAPERPWKPLFDGTSTAAWRGFRQTSFPAKGWSVREGALVVEAGGGGGDLVTVEEFADFALAFDFRVASKANSGVMYRVAEDQDATWYTGPEFQVLSDDYGSGEVDAKHSAGALYDLAAAAGAALVPVGRFNRGLIVVRGWRVQHWVNGVKVVDCDLASADGKARIAASKFASMPGFAQHARGRIALQDHGDEVAYRNVRIRDLGGDAAAAEASARAPIELFNGKDTRGWTFHLSEAVDPAQVWSVRDGVLVCKGVPAGYIRTQADYTNYVLELDWRWSGEAGNSGVLVRMVGEDKVWPKSLEAQLQSGNAGDFWKIDEYPATTDPARTKGRNCKKTHANEKPVGEWNHYRITVDRGTVTLEVNDQVLNQATEVLETPGKICLQSEGAEIHFKNVRLTPLP